MPEKSSRSSKSSGPVRRIPSKPSSADTVKPEPIQLKPETLFGEQMLSDALTVAPEAREVGRKPGAVVVARVPAGWGHVICKAWIHLVHGHPHDALSFIDDEAENVGSTFDAESILPMTLVSRAPDRNGSGSSPVSESRVVSALVSNDGLFVAIEEDSPAPATLFAAADVELVLPAPSGATLAALAMRLAPGPCNPPPDEQAALLRPIDLAFARRPGQTAADFIRRLGRLLAAVAKPDSIGLAPPSPAWTLDTLPLAPEVEAWARQVASDLRAYANGDLPWTEVDHGALLSGPPGCGKTTIAAALAASSGVPLIATSYSILEGGRDGKSRYSDILKNLRGTFVEARKLAPCILLFDELDSLPARGNAAHNESWFAPILNALLTEAVAEARPGVVFLGATNFPENIDPALRRSGRLDRIVRIEMPDAAQLGRILGAHLPDLNARDREDIAISVTGHSGADIARLARSARRRARAAGRITTGADVLEALDGDMQPRPLSRQRRIAVHEAGHVLVTELRRPGATQFANLRGNPSQPRSLGLSRMDIPDDVDTLAQIEGHLTELMAGRAAEQVMLGDASAGAMGDLKLATELSLAVEMSYGLGGHLFGLGDVYADDVARILMTQPNMAVAVEQRIRTAFETALSTLEKHRETLQLLADALLSSGALSRADISSLLGRGSKP